jgi:cytoskeletal protein CcmA (bactofilin family)
MTIDANAFPNTGGLIVNQYLGVLGNIVVGQNLTVEGIATYSNIIVTGITANLTTASYITSTQNISANTAQFSGNVTSTQNISANTAQFSGNVNVASNVAITGNISANTAQFSGNVNVASNVAITGNISANAAQFSGNVAVTGNISALANLFVIGNLVVSGNTYQTGNIIFTSPGTLSFSSDSVVPKSYIDSALIVWGV